MYPQNKLGTNTVYSHQIKDLEKYYNYGYADKDGELFVITDDTVWILDDRVQYRVMAKYNFTEIKNKMPAQLAKAFTGIKQVQFNEYAFR